MQDPSTRVGQGCLCFGAASTRSAQKGPSMSHGSLMATSSPAPLLTGILIPHWAIRARSHGRFACKTSCVGCGTVPQAVRSDMKRGDGLDDCERVFGSRGNLLNPHQASIRGCQRLGAQAFRSLSCRPPSLLLSDVLPRQLPNQARPILVQGPSGMYRGSRERGTVGWVPRGSVGTRRIAWDPQAQGRWSFIS